MAIKSIRFNSPMVRAILDGRKTVTRRVVEPQPVSKLAYCMAGYKHGTWSYPSDDAWKAWGDAYKQDTPIHENERFRNWTPPYLTGDVLWVRETWNYGCFDSNKLFTPLQINYDHNNYIGAHVGYVYQQNSSYGEGCLYSTKNEKGQIVPVPWRTAISMPREAARIWLRVTNVRVERLQDIDEAGAKAEGSQTLTLIWDEKPERTARENFALLWDNTINLTDCNRCGWEANPWVWVIEFERCEKPTCAA